MIMHTTPGSIAKCAAWWRSHAHPDFGPFGLPEWVEAYRRAFGDQTDLRLLELIRDSSGDDESPSAGSSGLHETMALIPMEIDKGGILRFVGGTEVTDYAGPVCARADVVEAAEGLATWLAEHPDDWAECIFEAVPEDLGFGGPLIAGATRRGLAASRESTEVCAVLNLPESFDDYLAGLQKKDRHELRRKWNRFGRDAGEAVLVTADSRTLDADLELFFEWHRQAQGSKGGFMSDRMEAFFADVAKVFMDLGMLCLEFVEVAGERYASSFGFADDRCHYLYNSAFRQDARSLSPGMVMIWLTLQKGLDNGISRLDFLQGDERYKFQLGAQVRPLDAITIRHRGD